MTLEKVEFVENDYEHKIGRLDTIEAEVQRVLDYLGEQQRRLDEKNISADKMSPASVASPRHQVSTSTMACETMITSANFDFESGMLKCIDKIKNRYFKECREISPNKKTGDFVIDVPLGSPQKQAEQGGGSSHVSNKLMHVISFGKSVESPELNRGNSPSQLLSPTLNMLGDIERLDDEARSARSFKLKTKIKKKKSGKSMKLNLIKAPSDDEKSEQKKKPVIKLKPLLLNDSWEEIKPIKTTSQHLKPLKPQEPVEKPEERENTSSDGSIKSSSSSSSMSSGSYI